MNFSKKINKILVIRLSSMGDVILTSHLIRILKKSYPEAQIDFAVSKQYSEIYKYNPNISNIFEYDKSLPNSKIIELRNEFLKSNGIEKYDLIIDLQRNIRSMNLRNGIYNKLVKVKKHRLNKLSLVYFKNGLMNPTKSIPEIYLESLSELGIKDDGKGLELWLPEEKDYDKYPPEIRNTNKNIERIAIAPGAFHFTKRWLPEGFTGLIIKLKEKFNAEIILIGGKSDIEICGQIKSGVNFKVSDYSGSESIIETARLIDSCDLLITNDTGVMHIAAARQVPVVAIFGSTIAAFGFSPFRVPNIIIEKQVPCRPCTHIGRDSCPKKHFNCMKLISAEDVIDGVNKLFEGN
jgi:ADP-heptose:LPS heptosyltransferase